MTDLSRLIFVLLCALTGNVVCAADKINFSHEILPILSDRCFHCHGPDPTHREADLRLDLVEAATENRDGTFAIAPGKPELSEVLARITSSDSDLLMPPADSHRKPLTKKQIATIRQWIAEGAQWGKHWSFEPPVKVALHGQEANLNPIDALVQRKLTEARLTFSEPASRRTLIRRLSFDLTGLPPSVEDVEAFVNDNSPDADLKLVNRLLKSKHYGERMAMWWLDLARYS
ncbi:MAG TPA: hypothetical protein DCM07_13985, partial [Planctomycetaceae bacterium]|nr:hypothetical protein [Planctomycetaceae bacterium]